MHGPHQSFAEGHDGRRRRRSVFPVALLSMVGAITAMALAPTFAAAGPLTPFAYVTGSGPAAGVAVIDTSTNTVVANVPGVTQAGGVATTPDGAFVYVTMTNGDSVAVINTSTNSVVATVAVSHPTDVAITPNGAFAYVVAGNGVAVI